MQCVCPHHRCIGSPTITGAAIGQRSLPSAQPGQRLRKCLTMTPLPTQWVPVGFPDTLLFSTPLRVDSVSRPGLDPNCRANGAQSYPFIPRIPEYSAGTKAGFADLNSETPLWEKELLISYPWLAETAGPLDIYISMWVHKYIFKTS